MRLVFTDRAQADLLEAWFYIVEDNLAAADRVLEAVEQESKVLLMQPLMGRARPELGNQVRSWPSATPYILFYGHPSAGAKSSTRAKVAPRFQTAV